MKITYVKIYRRKESVKDPVYHWIKEILPNDRLDRAEVPDHIALLGDRKIEFAMCSSRPEIMIDSLRHDAGKLSERLCPDCGHEMISFFVSSPDWTWAQLCGRAGRLTYCPMCKTQHEFWLQIMN